MALPFMNKYPYTSFEQLNLDGLMEKVGTFDARITDNTNRITALDGRVTTAELNINELDSRLDVAEDDIKGIKDRLEDDENAIESLTSRVDDAESDISGIQERLEQAELDVDGCEDRLDNLEPRVQTNENNITALEGRMDSADDAINAHTEEIDVIQESIRNLPAVVANPGGTGAPLNTILIGEDVYKIEGGGSGGGSSVTPNPAGEPTAGELTKIDIDGAIYKMPGCGCGPRLDVLDQAVATLDGNVQDLEDNKSNKLIVDKFTWPGSGINVPKYSWGSYVHDISKEGYTPLAIVGYDLNAHHVASSWMYLEGSTLHLQLNNSYSVTEVAHPDIYILYVTN